MAGGAAPLNQPNPATTPGGWIAQHLSLVASVGLVLGFVVIGRILRPKTAPTDASSTQATGDLSGLDTGPGGAKIVYVPTADAFYNIYDHDVMTYYNVAPPPPPGPTSPPVNTPPVSVTPPPINIVINPPPRPAPTPTPAPAPAPAPPPVRRYTVVRGDSLWSIAVKFYGNGAVWGRIYDANRATIKDPHWIYPGQSFIIP